jgi:hypothetical protein
VTAQREASACATVGASWIDCDRHAADIAMPAASRTNPQSGWRFVSLSMRRCTTRVVEGQRRDVDMRIVLRAVTATDNSP